MSPPPPAIPELRCFLSIVSCHQSFCHRHPPSFPLTCKYVYSRLMYASHSPDSICSASSGCSKSETGGSLLLALEPAAAATAAGLRGQSSCKPTCDTGCHTAVSIQAQIVEQCRSEPKTWQIVPTICNILRPQSLIPACAQHSKGLPHPSQNVLLLPGLANAISKCRFMSFS